jgi:hypothetical protein|tara:strand:+ start:276 stop:692 length:417 start_codon:yes stop_codon:yes gene_type:complete
MFTPFVRLESGRVVHGQKFDGPGAFLIKVFFPLQDYVRGEEVEEAPLSITIQYDFGSRSKPMDFEINDRPANIDDIYEQRTEDLSNRIILTLGAFQRELEASDTYLSRRQADRLRLTRPIQAQIRRFSQASNVSRGVY